jgi:hypothetical protein
MDQSRMTPSIISKATSNNAKPIAKIFTSGETSSFLHLQLGSVDPATLSDDLTNRIVESTEKPGQIWTVACDDETREVVNYAQGLLPRGDFETIVEQTPEVASSECTAVARMIGNETAGESQVDRGLPEQASSQHNKTLVIDCRRNLRSRREAELKQWRHYNMATFLPTLCVV